MDSFSSSYRLTDAELALWLKFIEYHIGFVLPNSQQNWIKGTIERYLVKLDITHPQFFEQVAQDTALFHQFFDEILIPRTQFFRHPATFELVARYASAWKHQQHLHSAANFKTDKAQDFVAWSVGSATGQEPVSMALTLAQVFASVTRFQVWASDYHQQALAVAKLGEYDIAEQASIPTYYHKWLEVKNTQKFIVQPTLLERINYFSFNLMQRQSALPVQKKQCQIIMCQNVLIYFRQFEQRDIIRFLSQYLADDGIVILGAGEAAQLTSSALIKVANSSVEALVKPTAPTWVSDLIIEY